LTKVPSFVDIAVANGDVNAATLVSTASLPE
jgi:hypothetical protein